MQIEQTVLDDFKTERADITPPLPQVARIVPLLFYISLIGSISLSALFFLKINDAKQKRDVSLAAETKRKKQLTSTRQERTALEARAKRASDIMVWTESVRPLQPIIVGVTRTLNSEATISELSLNRRADQQNQMTFGIKLNGASVTELDQLLAQFFDRGYRAYSPEQKLASGQIDYQATLLWQAPATSVESESPDAESNTEVRRQ